MDLFSVVTTAGANERYSQGTPFLERTGLPKALSCPRNLTEQSPGLAVSGRFARGPVQSACQRRGARKKPSAAYSSSWIPSAPHVGNGSSEFFYRLTVAASSACAPGAAPANTESRGVATETRHGHRREHHPLGHPGRAGGLGKRAPRGASLRQGGKSSPKLDKTCKTSI